MLRRWYRLAWIAVASLVAFTGACGGVLLLRSWTLLFLAMTAACVALATAAGFSESGRRISGARLTAALWVGLVSVAGLVLLVEWVAFALVTAVVVAGMPLVGARRLSTPDLCARWNADLEALRAAGSAAEAVAVLRDRARCLDELERRDPEGFRRWLASPGADPATVLRRKRHDVV
jgi:hypothetical protein